MKRFVFVAVALLGAFPLRSQEPARTLTIDAFLSLDRVSDPQYSPDGAWISYTVTTTDLAANTRTSDVWLVATRGGESRLVSDRRWGGRSARWSPDGSSLAYVTTRTTMDELRIYDLATRRSRRLLLMETGIDGPVWSPTGEHLAFTSMVYPECGDAACSVATAAQRRTESSSARVYDDLLYRHWNRWDDGRRSHLFVVQVRTGALQALLAGKDYDVPPPPFGDASDYTFSADGRSILFTTKMGNDQAWNTNTDLFEIPVDGGEPQILTAGSDGGDRHPAVSPDGTKLAFLSQARPGFESDRWRIMLRDLTSGATVDLTRDFAQSVGQFAWLPSSQGIVFTAEHQQRTIVFRIDTEGRVREVSRWGNNASLTVAGTGDFVATVNDAINRPGQIYRIPINGGAAERLTHHNDDRLDGVVMHPAEEISWIGADGRTVYGMLVKPPQFRRGDRYPLVILIHGGPQGAWLDNFHSRWNAQAFAAQGYVTVLINPRGSTGFGQHFVDQVSRDWGGRVYIDVMSGVEHAARFSFVDSTRIAAAGGSYGGYMINWINAHSRRFDALISHAGVYNLEAFYGSTEELWFPEWEFGAPPWENRTLYEQWSPHRFAQNFRTPTLVIQGALDFRVPDTQGLELFTALRRQSVPARLVYFPDEGHWISKPQNQKRWWSEVHAWLEKYLASSPTP